MVSDAQFSINYWLATRLYLLRDFQGLRFRLDEVPKRPLQIHHKWRGPWVVYTTVTAGVGAWDCQVMALVHRQAPIPITPLPKSLCCLMINSLVQRRCWGALVDWNFPSRFKGCTYGYMAADWSGHSFPAPSLQLQCATCIRAWSIRRLKSSDLGWDLISFILCRLYRTCSRE